MAPANAAIVRIHLTDDISSMLTNSQIELISTINYRNTSYALTRGTAIVGINGPSAANTLKIGSQLISFTVPPRTTTGIVRLRRTKTVVTIIQ